jgi:hypothetical protein
MANRIKLKGTTEKAFDLGLTNKFTLDATGFTANRTWILPDSNGSNGYVLSTNGSGTLSWVAQTGGGAQARIQFTAASDGTGQTFTDAGIAQFTNNLYANVFVNGVLLQTSEYSISGTTLTVSRYLSTGDNIIVAATSAGGAYSMSAVSRSSNLNMDTANEYYVTPTLSLPTMAAGSAYEIRYYLESINWGAFPFPSITTKIRVGSAGTTADTTVFDSGSIALGSPSAVPLEFSGIVTFSSATATHNGIGGYPQLANSNVFYAGASGLTPTYIGLTLQITGGTPSVTDYVTVLQASITRIS